MPAGHPRRSTLGKGGAGVKLQAANTGAWGNNLQATVDYQGCRRPPNRRGTSRSRTRPAGRPNGTSTSRPTPSSTKSLTNVLQASQLVQYVSGADQLPVTPATPRCGRGVPATARTASQIRRRHRPGSQERAASTRSDRRHLQYPLHSATGAGPRTPRPCRPNTVMPRNCVSNAGRCSSSIRQSEWTSVAAQRRPQRIRPPIRPPRDSPTGTLPPTPRCISRPSRPPIR